MEVRNNVRQRRRERIRQLTAERPENGRYEPEDRSWFGGREEDPRLADESWENDGEFAGADGNRQEGENSYPPGLSAVPDPWPDSTAPGDRPEPEHRFASEEGGYPRSSSVRDRAEREEPDPEKWWKEKQRSEHGRKGSGDSGHGGTRAASNATPPRTVFSWPDSAREPGTEPGRSAGTGPIGSLSSLSPYRGLSGRSGWDEEPPEGGQGSFLRRFVRGLTIRTIAAVVLLGAGWGWIRLDLPGSQAAEAWTARTVTQDMNFAAVEAWYERTFGGTPAFLPIFKQQNPSQEVSAAWSRNGTVPPIAGRIVQTFAQDGTGVRLAAPAGTPVIAVHTGRVTQVTVGEQGYATILVQHANRVVTIYGNVDNPAVQPDDWVEAGTALGELASSSAGGEGEGTLYFAVKRNGKTLDPAEVVPFD